MTLRRAGEAARLRAPYRLALAPQDIRTGDPTRAADIYSGYFAFDGQLLHTQGYSIFALAPPSASWARALYGFGWLRHMRAAGTPLARANARALVRDFLALRGRRKPAVATEPKVVARRLISWLSQSPMLLEGADEKFYNLFLLAMLRDAVKLRVLIPVLDAEDRLLAAAAVAAYVLCADVPERRRSAAIARLSQEIDAQILPDGGHIGRNPQTLIDLLLDFLPLKQTFTARGGGAPPSLARAIDRMLLMLRLLRHGEGSLALFNGMSATPFDSLATALAYDDARGQALAHAPQTGYQRLEGAGGVLIADCGAPPPLGFSRAAHAGALSFEFSDGRERLIVNCGAPVFPRPGLVRAARQTAAHSTLVLDDVSSCRFAKAEGWESFIAEEVTDGPESVASARAAEQGGEALDLSHDGYARKFGLIHARRLFLKKDGGLLQGWDSLRAAPMAGEKTARSFAIRFHLHPSVAASPVGAAAIHLRAARGAEWLFEAEAGDLSLEESIFFATPGAAQMTQQIIIKGPVRPGEEIMWRLRRLASEAPGEPQL